MTAKDLTKTVEADTPDKPSLGTRVWLSLCMCVPLGFLCGFIASINSSSMEGAGGFALYYIGLGSIPVLFVLGLFPWPRWIWWAAGIGCVVSIAIWIWAILSGWL